MNRQFTHRAGYMLICFLFFYQFSSAQETLSLDACLSRVRAANPDTRQLAITESTRVLQQKINTQNYLPQASLNGKATWQSDVTNIGMDFPGIEITTPDRDQYAVTLDVTQSVYDGGYTAAQHQVLEQQATLSTLQYQTGIQFAEELATELFHQALLQQQLIFTSDLLIGQLIQIIKTLENNYANGVLYKQDLLAARVKLKEAQQKREEAADNTSKAKSSLAILMGDHTLDFEIEHTSKRIPGSTNGEFDKRPEMQMLQAQTQLIEGSERLSRTQYHPRVSLFASAGYGKPGLNFLSDAFDNYFIAGATVHIPLSQLYTRKLSRESQVFQLRQEELELKKEKLLLDFHIKEQQRVDEIKKLTVWLTEDEQIISLRKEMLEIAKARHEAGTITITDYLEELTELSLAEERMVTHEIMLQREQALLEQLYGIQN